MIFSAWPEERPGIRETMARWRCHADKVLNQRAESKRDGRVAISTALKNKFTIRLRLKVRSDRFQSAVRRYADK
jgi:hypothetical protein